MESLERENGGWERLCREVEEEVRESEGHCSQKLRPRAVVAHHGPWPHCGGTDCGANILFIFFSHVFMFCPFYFFFSSNHKLQK